MVTVGRLVILPVIPEDVVIEFWPRRRGRLEIQD
jgi:hypothetical protein